MLQILPTYTTLAQSIADLSYLLPLHAFTSNMERQTGWVVPNGQEKAYGTFVSFTLSTHNMFRPYQCLYKEKTKEVTITQLGDPTRIQLKTTFFAPLFEVLEDPNPLINYIIRLYSKRQLNTSIVKITNNKELLAYYKNGYQQVFNKLGGQFYFLPQMLLVGLYHYWDTQDEAKTLISDSLAFKNREPSRTEDLEILSNGMENLYSRILSRSPYSINQKPIVIRQLNEWTRLTYLGLTKDQPIHYIADLTETQLKPEKNDKERIEEE